MLCDICKKNQAQISYRQVAGGQETILHLCPSCMANMGLLGGGILAGALFGEGHTPQVQRRCPGCGSTFEQIAEKGKLGCAQCYDFFGEDVARMVGKIHGNLTHQGKIPHSAHLAPRQDRSAELAALQEEMQAAVESQNFERAVVLRDQIRALEQPECARGEGEQ